MVEFQKKIARLAKKFMPLFFEIKIAGKENLIRAIAKPSLFGKFLAGNFLKRIEQFLKIKCGKR